MDIVQRLTFAAAIKGGLVMTVARHTAAIVRMEALVSALIRAVAQVGFFLH